MNATDTLVRTAKGEQEIATNINKLPIKHRSVLIMIDGKNSEQSLQGKLSGMFDGKSILKDLESHGYIERKAAPRPALRPVETQVPPLNLEAKKFMVDSIYQVLGPEGDTIVSRIERCKSNNDLSGMIDACRDTIAGIGKRKRAEEFEARVKGLLA